MADSNNVHALKPDKVDPSVARRIEDVFREEEMLSRRRLDKHIELLKAEHERVLASIRGELDSVVRESALRVMPDIVAAVMVEGVVAKVTKRCAAEVMGSVRLSELRDVVAKLAKLLKLGIK